MQNFPKEVKISNNSIYLIFSNGEILKLNDTLENKTAIQNYLATSIPNLHQISFFYNLKIVNIYLFITLNILFVTYSYIYSNNILFNFFITFFNIIINKLANELLDIFKNNQESIVKLIEFTINKEIFSLKPKHKKIITFETLKYSNLYKINDKDTNSFSLEKVKSPAKILKFKSK